MTLAIPDPRTQDEVVDLVSRLRANRLPPPIERRSIRRTARATLKDVAVALKVDEMTVSRWERGIAEPWPRHRATYICLLLALTEVAHEQDPKTQK